MSLLLSYLHQYIFERSADLPRLPKLTDNSERLILFRQRFRTEAELTASYAQDQPSIFLHGLSFLATIAHEFWKTTHIFP